MKGPTLFPAFQSGDLRMATLSPGIRRCANIKSRKTPDVRCMLNATSGDYCARHSLHPRPFHPKRIQEGEEPPSFHAHAVAKRLQSWWRRRAPVVRTRSQGLGLECLELSRNDTELFTLGPIREIPKLYLFTLTGSNHTLWTFDIRTLAQILTRDSMNRENPYTREPFSETVLARMYRRISWLRKRKYSILYPQGPAADFTADQVWRQRVLDSFMRIEALGFHVSSDWFHAFTVRDHETFYTFMYNLWYSRLGLTMEQRNAVVPLGEAPTHRLFRSAPNLLCAPAARHTKAWWEKWNLGLIDAFLTRSQDKEQQRLGAIYVLMGLVEICQEAAEAFPWVAETIASES